MWPVVVKNKRTPKAQISTGAPMYDASQNNSGAAYGGDPQNVLNSSSWPENRKS